MVVIWFLIINYSIITDIENYILKFRLRKTFKIGEIWLTNTMEHRVYGSWMQ